MSDSVTEVLNNYEVYTGVWTNYAKGSVRGATVTTTTKHGALLIAFLALYVQIVGTRFWRILCFAFHQYLSTSEGGDGFYHQRQVVLRNVGTDYSSLFEFLRVGWAWRGRTRRSLRRTLPLCLAALTHIAVFTVAGVFSSYVTDTAGNEVLLSNSNGGFLNASTPYLEDSLENDLLAAVPYSSELATASATYAQQCYNANASSQACGTYVQSNFDSSRTTVSCPFGGNICLNDTGIRIDSGPLNSQIDFGINAKSGEQFTWRTVTTCAVIETDGYEQNVPDPAFNSSAYPLLELYYGMQQLPMTNDSTNYTYAWHTALSQPLVGVQDYILEVLGYNVGIPNEDNWWLPISELVANDADSFIFFLSTSQLGCILPVNDSWFAMHQYNNDTELYYSDRSVSPLACQVQYQFCNPNRLSDTDGGCSPLSGAIPTDIVTQNVTGFWSSTAQQQSAYLFALVLNGFSSTDISQLVANLGARALLARDSLSAGAQGPLPGDQWQLEVQHWHDAILAWVQRLVVEQATGPSDPAVEQFKQLVDAANPVVSQPQIIRSPSYTSFSVLGMSLILAIGTLLILLSFTIEPLIGHLQRHSPLATTASHHRRAEWLSDQKFQMQRMAFEGAGSGPWLGALNTVPVTAGRGEKLPRLDLRDHKYPRLKHAGREMGGMEGGGLKGGFGVGIAVAGKGKGEGDQEHDLDASSTAKLRLNTQYADLDDTTTYTGGSGSLGMPTPGLETPASLGLGHVRTESWRVGAADRGFERERERLVPRGLGPGAGREQSRSPAYVDVTRDGDEE